MNITKRTLTSTVLPFLTKDEFENILEKCEEVPLDKSLFHMTCGEFIKSLDDSFVEDIFKERYILDVFGKLKTYKREMDQIERYLKKNEFKPTADEERATQGIHFPSFPERILMTVTEYFHLKSFEEAENIPFSNYMIIINAKNADSKYERQYNRIMENKAKMKNK